MEIPAAYAQKIKQEQHIQKLFIDLPAGGARGRLVPRDGTALKKVVCIWRLPGAGNSKK